MSATRSRSPSLAIRKRIGTHEAPERSAGRVDLLIALLLGVSVFAICVVNLAEGHDWGDDFALYIGQAKGIVEFDTGSVLEANRYALEHSTTKGFSPFLYPWGFPLLLAPFYSVWGIDYQVFQVLESALFAVFIGLFALLVIPRVGRLAAIVMTVLLGSSVAYIGWAQSVTSDFAFMAFLALTLLLSDRARRTGIVTAVSNGLLMALGLSAALAASMRREGMLLFVVIVAVQAAALWSEGLLDSRPVRLRNLPWNAILLPHMAGLALLAAFQAVFPGPPATFYGNTGPQQLGENVNWFSDVLARMVGLMQTGDQPQIFGSETAGLTLLLVFAIFAVAGLLDRMLIAWREDVGLATYLVLAALIFGFLPFHEGRYLFTITPFLVYFAYQGIVAVVGFLARPIGARWAAILSSVVAVAFLGVLAGSNIEQLWDRTESRIDDDGEVMWGPAHPASQELFATVKSVVPNGETVGFFRGRAMTLLGERQGLYLSTLEDILSEADWYAMEKNSDYSQYLLTDAEAQAHGITRVWENERFVLWEVP